MWRLTMEAGRELVTERWVIGEFPTIESAKQWTEIFDRFVTEAIIRKDVPFFSQRS